ncbi:hypothetical protein ACFVJH_34490 [Streptomyces decoyicus]
MSEPISQQQLLHPENEETNDEIVGVRGWIRAGVEEHGAVSRAQRR